MTNASLSPIQSPFGAAVGIKQMCSDADSQIDFLFLIKFTLGGYFVSAPASKSATPISRPSAKRMTSSSPDSHG